MYKNYLKKNYIKNITICKNWFIKVYLKNNNNNNYNFRVINIIKNYYFIQTSRNKNLCKKLYLFTLFYFFMIYL